MTDEELARLEARAVQLRKGEALSLIAAVREARKIADLWKRQREADNKRWQQRWQKQVEYTNAWHGRYEVLRHENNKLRKKLKPTAEPAAAPSAAPGVEEG